MRNKFYLSTILITIVVILISSLTIGRQIYLERQPDLFSFSLIHFSGYLFFLLMPVEILFAYYAIEGFNLPVLLTAALLTAMAAQIIDYVIGYLVSRQVINKMIGKERYKRTKGYIDKYGNLTVFVFNSLPLSSSVLSLVAGMLRYNFKNLVIYSFLGLLLKYIIVVFLFG
ncbi:MAG: VTT domain-containing protein [Candidatus Woesearchaeota archaeon]|nr:VTT domain-containing protein [Candidatus Woesearchaeota archaeon]MDP7623110.1 VTT domain-containing protein [Candidatus Woesearchaeota archaeon]HJN57137.1 VTT domain-containing protein [Candidatus Woesearchaeota archaeon]